MTTKVLTAYEKELSAMKAKASKDGTTAKVWNDRMKCSDSILERVGMTREQARHAADRWGRRVA